MVDKAEGKTPTQVLYEAGEDLRVDNPVLWAIVRGRGGIARIGILSGQSRRVIEAQVDALMKNGTIYVSDRYATPVYMLNSKGSGYGRLKKIAAFYEALELSWVENTGLDLSKEKGLTSSSTFKKWREKHPEIVQSSRSERYDDTLTMKQAAVLVAVGRAWADRSTFKPLELARAQGYSQGGFAKQSLLTLEGKGFVQEAGKNLFRLTHAGVEKVEELQRAGVKPAHREPEAPLDISEL